MAQPVWVLSVDLQTKTATFQTGMADAAKAARGSFNDIKSGAGEMGQATGYSMMEARHSVMLLGEEFGVHLPRALTSFIASIGPVGAAMEAAFPFLAIAVGATLLLEHMAKMKEEGEKLTEDQVKFGTAVSNAFNQLDTKLLEAGIRADELNKDHLGALRLQLELIDKQSMSELVRAFDEVAKKADVVFGDLKAHWYEAGVGSAGAQHALTQFKKQYDALLAAGKDKDAADLLAGTRASAEHVLALMREAKANQTNVEPGHNTQNGDYLKFEAAVAELKKTGAGFTDRELQSQEALVQALEAQAGVQDRVNALKKIQGDNAKHTTQNTLDDEADRVLRAQFEAERQGVEEQDKLQRAAREQAIQNIQQGEREKIEATDKGTAERLAAISKAIQEEERYGLEGTSFYRDLLTQRVETTRAMMEEERKLAVEAAREEADNAAKMAEIALAAEKEHQQLLDSAHRVSVQERVQEEIQAANELYTIKLTAFAQEIAALDKHAKDYENKLKAIQDKETQLTRQHENEITAIQDKAEIERNARILAGYQRFDDDIARGLSNVLLHHQSFAAMIGSISDQIASGMIQNAIKSILADDMTKEHDAAAAARKAYIAGMSFPFPVNIVMGPALGAAAFASVMAFAEGGIVPGVGTGDIVPAMLTPGEAVLPKELTEGLTNASRGGSATGGNVTHVHVRPTYHINTIDGDGMRDALNKHTDVLQKHMTNALRKMNGV